MSCARIERIMCSYSPHTSYNLIIQNKNNYVNKNPPNLMMVGRMAEVIYLVLGFTLHPLYVALSIFNELD